STKTHTHSPLLVCSLLSLDFLHNFNSTYPTFFFSCLTSSLSCILHNTMHTVKIFRRGRLFYVFLAVSVIISCFHPQLINATRSNTMFKDNNVTGNNANSYGGWVADNEREVPTGPDPLHNREDQT
ncbi:hypothetical protein KSS87_017145, partial [Heliosperma pusillum]